MTLRQNKVAGTTDGPAVVGCQGSGDRVLHGVSVLVGVALAFSAIRFDVSLAELKDRLLNELGQCRPRRCNHFELGIARVIATIDATGRLVIL